MHRFLLMSCVALLAVACSRSEPASNTPPPVIGHQVVEQFEVGAGTYVRSLHLDGDRLYVGTSTGVLVVDRKSGDMMRTFTTADGMRNNYAFVVRPGPGGSLWMGTNGGGLALWREKAMETYFSPKRHGLADLWVYDVAWQDDGTTWLATWDGVNRITGDPADRANWTTYNVKDGLANPWVYAIQIDRYGAVWFGTEGGLSRFKDGSWKTWRHADGLGADNPKGLARSNQSGFGSIRAGEHSHDLTTLDETGAETYNENYVFSLKIDSRGVLWIGTWGGGLSRFFRGAFTNYTEADGLAGNVVYSIAEGPDDALWMGTNHGISRFHEGQWTRYGREEGLMGEDVYTIAVSPDNTVWAGQRGGVSRLAPLHPAAT